MLPEGWQEYKLKDVVQKGRKICYGIVQPGEYTASGIPLIRGRDYSFGWVALEELFRVSEDIDRPYKRSKVKKNDLLLTIVGAGTGNTAIVPDFLEGANITQTTARIAVNHTKFFYLYVDHLLQSSLGQREVYRYIKGGAQPGLNIGDVENFSFIFPPYEEQQRISSLISIWSQSCEKLRELIALKEKQKKALIQCLLTGKHRFPEFEGQKWKKVKADKIFKNYSKKNNPDEPLLAVMQDIGVVPRDMLDRRVAMPEGSTEGYKLIESGDFVISLRSFQGGLEYSRYRGIVSPAYTILKSIRPINDDFFRHYFKSYEFIGRLAIAVIGIRDGKQISYDDFSFMDLPCPSIEEQNKIAAILNAADKEIALLTQKLAAYQEQKKALMQQLLTGKKRVKAGKQEAA